MDDPSRVNFTNILTVEFSYERFLHYNLRIVLFWCKNIGTKAAHKMLVKLTPQAWLELNLIKILGAYLGAINLTELDS
jgi:hypothetical protein